MKRILFVFMWVFSSVKAYADIMGVEDIALLQQLIKEYKLLTSQLDTLKAQKKTLEDGFNANKSLLEGHYGYASKFETPSLKTWQHGETNFENLLDSYSKENAGSNTELRQLAKLLEKDYPVRTRQEIYAPNSEAANLYERLAKTTLASRATNTLAYNKIDEELSMLDSLQSQIEQSPNSKSTLDLIARLQVESVKLMAIKIKADAVNAELLALKTQEESTDFKWAADFFK